jgi:hypothetical protein
MKINTPDQNKAIASIMTKRRKAWKSDGRSVKDFPRFYAGQTTTKDYIEMFLASRNLIECPMVFADRAAPFLVGPEATAEEVAE